MSGFGIVEQKGDFRLWDTVQEKMIYDNVMCDSHGIKQRIHYSEKLQEHISEIDPLGGDYYLVDYTDYYLIENTVMMRYICNDSQGNKVYDGDIIEGPHGLHPITWDGAGYTFWYYSRGGLDEPMEDPISCYMDYGVLQGKVVGNLFENSDLLIKQYND